ncbi:hypothetical protein KP2612_002953 [Komagataella phaffii]|uniref:Uncharacterized protein n=1 Tax=Komagataella phaffii (strain GS115 / ATCC 20864) TaxID=644223 RepID=C4QZJ0_KOMPG|nr:Hypothetical protein PAS_chr2-1_0063 [Komagataella phaffii GS115]AOA62789.1 GQ67_00086T0 [Komagataella phaffii]AOA67783.1 GQ68_01301T0 [Komagataella phaffii GS115]CAH2448841.1 Conserved predicted protein [Komagataella phaffii CBS 7435]CAY68664.1 Hypothetical protein PAS_chr2-1_0063 [Komagataella phaffii GS115]
MSDLSNLTFDFLLYEVTPVVISLSTLIPFLIIHGLILCDFIGESNDKAERLFSLIINSYPSLTLYVLEILNLAFPLMIFVKSRLFNLDISASLNNYTKHIPAKYIQITVVAIQVWRILQVLFAPSQILFKGQSDNNFVPVVIFLVFIYNIRTSAVQSDEAVESKLEEYGYQEQENSMISLQKYCLAVAITFNERLLSLNSLISFVQLATGNLSSNIEILYFQYRDISPIISSHPLFNSLFEGLFHIYQLGMLSSILLATCTIETNSYLSMKKFKHTFWIVVSLILIIEKDFLFIALMDKLED